MRKVVVTGLGGVTPIGNNVNEYWDNLINGVSGIYHLSRFDAKLFRCKVGGEIRNFKIEDFFMKEEVEIIKEADDSVKYGLSAAKMALEDAKVTPDLLVESEKWGIILGQTVGGCKTGEAGIRYLLKERRITGREKLYRSCTIDSVLTWFNSILLNNISYYGAMISTGCAAGTDAIGQGFHLVRDGLIDIAIVGGLEAPLTPLVFSAFDVVGAMAKHTTVPAEASCPFSLKRSGFVLAEGAGIVIIEELEHAVRRGANIYGEVKGYGNNSSAYHMTAPDPSGKMLGEAMLEAIEDAGCSKEEIDHINAHGSSTPLNDVSETRAIKYAFGKFARGISINSTKSMIGHPLGAAGALEFISAILALKKGIVPPTINLNVVDPECDLDYTPNVAKKRELRYVMSNSAGFGGVNCSLIFGRI